MLEVRTQDGALFAGDSAAAVVSQMRRDNWNAPVRKLEYMEEVAERVLDATGQAVRVDSAAHFLGDLERTGWVQVEIVLTLPAVLVGLAVDLAHSSSIEDPGLAELVAHLHPWLVQAGRAENEGVAPE